MKRTMLLLSIFLLAIVILASVQLAEAQQAGKVYRVGFLVSVQVVPLPLPPLHGITARAARAWVC